MSKSRTVFEYKEWGIISLLAAVFFSCTYSNEPAHTVCGCSGKEELRIVNEGGVIAQSVDGFKIISVEHGYLTFCGALPENLKVDGQLVQFSGNLIPTCTKEHSGYSVWSLYLELTEAKKIDTLYQSGPLTIEIVRTEDYGNPIGFGYILKDAKKSFTIEQFEIPAVSGNHPFQNSEDALKIAFMMSYKLRNFDDFPTIYLGDLYFLKIKQ